MSKESQMKADSQNSSDKIPEHLMSIAEMIIDRGESDISIKRLKMIYDAAHRVAKIIIAQRELKKLKSEGLKPH